jgi:hypothetical protein
MANAPFIFPNHMLIVLYRSLVIPASVAKSPIVIKRGITIKEYMVPYSSNVVANKLMVGCNPIIISIPETPTIPIAIAT